MPAELLDGAVAPAETLPFVTVEAFRDQTPAEGRVDVCRLVTVGMDTQRQLGIFGHAPFRPAADVIQYLAPDQAHRAERDRGHALIAAYQCADQIKAVFPVAHAQIGITFPAAVTLRRLDETHGGIVEITDDRSDEIRPYLVVAVDDADQLRLRVGMTQGEIQRAGFGAGQSIDMNKAEPCAQFAAVLLHRPP